MDESGRQVNRPKLGQFAQAASQDSQVLGRVLWTQCYSLSLLHCSSFSLFLTSIDDNCVRALLLLVQWINDFSIARRCAYINILPLQQACQ